MKKSNIRSIVYVHARETSGAKRASREQGTRERKRDRGRWRGREMEREEAETEGMRRETGRDRADRRKRMRGVKRRSNFLTRRLVAA